MSRVTSCMARTAAAMALLCLPQLLRPAPAQAQAIRRALTNIVSALTGELETTVTNGGAPEGSSPCSNLYNQNVSRIGEGAEPMGSVPAWLAAGYNVLKNTRAPLPICFEVGSDRLTNVARSLLKINNVFIDNDSMPGRSPTDPHLWDGYDLVGHIDEHRFEPDPALARRRAEAIQTQSTSVTCRFIPSSNPNQVEQVFRRKVIYSYRPAVPRCRR